MPRIAAIPFSSLKAGLLLPIALAAPAGFALKKDESQFREFVDRTSLDLEASGEAAKIFDLWFAPLPRDFRIQPD